jgi:hypothetical protein
MTQLKGADGAGYADEEFDGEGLVTQGDGALVASETAPSIGLERSYHAVHGNTVQVFRTTPADRDLSDAADLGKEPADVLAEKELLYNLATCPEQGRRAVSSRPTRGSPCRPTPKAWPWVRS